MRNGRAALILLAVQLLLVLSVAGKYFYERKVCPRIWVQAEQFDPNLALRGRYLALQLSIDTCSLPRDKAHYLSGYQYDGAHAMPGSWNWNVSLAAANGHLVPRLIDRPGKPDNMQQLSLRAGLPCDRGLLQSRVEYFISDRGKGPFPLKQGEELWVEVTVPPAGPPRPIQLALSSENGFQSLKFR